MRVLATPRAALGCMRLPAGDETTATAVVHAALDAGARLLDTADVYGPAADAPHANERLVARALATWTGRRADVVVATKGGLRREGTTWFPDGRRTHLIAAAQASADALGRPIDLWQWHAPDPGVPEATSLRAIASLAANGVVRAVGLCNVGLPTLTRALDTMPIASLQLELSLGVDVGVRSGAVEAALARGLLVLAHTPLGGAKGVRRLGRTKPVVAIAARLGVAPAEVVLAWLAAIHPRLVALPGATRVETARTAATAHALRLEPDDVAAIDALAPRIAALRDPRPVTGSRPTSRRDPDRGGPEIVVLIGSPAAGKSTAAASLSSDGARVLERDAIGGSLDALVMRMEHELALGCRRIVLDATWPTRAARRPIFEVARRFGATVRGVWLDTPVDVAQVHACRRLVATYGKLPAPEDLARLAKRDPHAFGPRALFSFRRAFEEPSTDEGFTSIERRAPAPHHVGAAAEASPASGRGAGPEGDGLRAVLIDLDGVLWSSRRGARAPTSADDVAVDEAVAMRLAGLASRGVRLWATTWRPDVESGLEREVDVAACVDALRARSALDLDVRMCPHGAGPPVCWCRKPMPGLAVELLAASGHPPASVLAVGKNTSDRASALRLGVRYLDVKDFVAGVPAPLAPG